VAVFLHDDRVKAPLEQVSVPPVAAVEALRVGHVEAPHTAAEIGVRGLDDEVIVVVHQTVGVAAPALLLDFAPEQVEKPCPVGVVGEDVLLGVAARGDVGDGARELEAELAGHDRIVASAEYKVK